ncbi:protein RALF-like 32 [Citrus sinensis]|nr:protein RALF-like 32 [Citrus sinensis]
MEIDMKKFCSLCLLLLAVSSVTAAAKESYKNGECDGSIAECGELAAEEFSMESETSKRVLAAAHKFISPGALRRDAPTLLIYVVDCVTSVHGCVSCSSQHLESGIATKIVMCHSCLILALLLFNKAATARSSKISNGSIAECSEEIEMFMESDISRRFLEERKKYITPGALKPDQPVCSVGGRGDAYSKSGGCLPPRSNRDTRGCPAYYRCRSGS